MSTNRFSDGPTQYRLPTNIKPTHYDLAIKTDLQQLTFVGLVKILLEVRSDTSTITLNSSGLDLGKATLRIDHQTVVVLDDPLCDAIQQRVTYKLTDILRAGSTAELKIAYTGELLSNMIGYYRSSWVNKGTTQYYALTQFEPTSARRAFPCWDEPLLKATFAITMISRVGSVNLSNMPALSEEPVESPDNPNLSEILSTTLNKQWKVTKFQTTPLMASYVVAFANGPFEFLEKSVVMPLSGKTVPLRIYATPDVIHQAQYSLNVTADVLPICEKIFDVEYPLPKLDTLVATDFDGVAMENWGLITGRTSTYLIDPDRADLKAKMAGAVFQAHEVAHMWFGNITTMEWWKYLYLNEGFATLVGELIVPDIIYPEWRVNSEFITTGFSSALNRDASLSSHPIEVECPDANHISEIFDALSYYKGASVLRMLLSYVGREQFLKGVSIYLKKHLFGNSVTHDLWDGISAATGLNITELMEAWITKTGFPVLSVTEVVDGIIIRQDRFLETGPASDEDNETIWNVPLNILAIQEGKTVIDRTPLLQQRETFFPLDTSKPFKLNAGTNGLYRVHYTPERLASIAKEASKKDSVFSLEDKLGLVFDSIALGKAGFANLSDSLNLIDKLKNDEEYLVWTAISNSLTDISSIWWEHPQIIDKLNKFCNFLYTPLIQKLGYDYPDGEHMNTAQLRSQVIEKAFEAGHDGVIAELKRRFKLYQDTGDDSCIPADLQRVIYSAATMYGGRREYDHMLKIVENPKTPMEQQSAIFAMGITQDNTLLAETFTFILEKARDQDVNTFFLGMAKNFKARRPMANFLFNEFETLRKRYEGGFQLGFLLLRTLSPLSSKEDYLKIEHFFQDKDTSTFYRSLAQTLGMIKAKSNTIKRSTKDLEEWLSANWMKPESV